VGSRALLSPRLCDVTQRHPRARCRARETRARRWTSDHYAHGVGGRELAGGDLPSATSPGGCRGRRPAPPDALLHRGAGAVAHDNDFPLAPADDDDDDVVPRRRPALCQAWAPPRVGRARDRRRGLARRPTSPGAEVLMSARRTRVAVSSRAGDRHNACHERQKRARRRHRVALARRHTASARPARRYHQGTGLRRDRRRDHGRAHASSDRAIAVPAYIVAAYWFTASTSFTNPAMTIARTFSDTFAGIRPVTWPHSCSQRDRRSDRRVLVLEAHANR
jgi:hypothetical protein